MGARAPALAAVGSTGGEGGLEAVDERFARAPARFAGRHRGQAVGVAVAGVPVGVLVAGVPVDVGVVEVPIGVGVVGASSTFSRGWNNPTVLRFFVKVVLLNSLL